MKIKLYLNILLLLICISLNAQKELWGVNNDQIVPLSGADYFGNITKYDINGQNPEKIHEFNITDGRNPTSKLFQASNGKIYGTTTIGGTFYPFADYGAGVLFEFDPIFNQYSVVHYFDYPNGSYLATGLGVGVIEPIIGKLYGMNGQKPYSYNINTGEFLTGNTIADYTVYGELTKASNGFLYGTTIDTGCPQSAPLSQQGTIFKINVATLNLQTVFGFGCTGTNGISPVGGFIEATPGKLYGVAIGGGGFYNAGVLFEFNTETNVFTKKITFDDETLGSFPYPLVDGGNGKLYGICKNGGTNTFTSPFNGITYTTHNGTLFEYTPATNSINKLYDFGPVNTNGTITDSGVNPISLLKTSNGYYMGTGEQNPFKFDSTNNTVVSTLNGTIPFNTNRLLNFIEVCRKPSYPFFDTDTFDGCIGGNFNYDLQNTNATTYQWLKDNVNVAGQTTGVLNLTNLTANDAGNYTCLMTNECGTTTSMVLQLTVNCLGTNTIAELHKSIKLYPNPATNWLNIELPKNIAISITNCSIINLLGQTIYQSTAANEFDVSKLQKGIYIVSLVTNYGEWNGMFIRE
ncbi:choice-of-anchor tandem repeat GloVer-containing protein [Flavobacterium sp. 25HG05S-40]|uniref:choice-of-anchor tandem repeat GloVer-containing protein n=1 Tax=Flavobacterium sp. 25HG05S-40 TaxID=3458682 RepID=UPI00404451E6